MIKQESLGDKEILVSPYNEGGKFSFIVETKKFTYIADEHLSEGGDDLGMNPFQFLYASLATCTAMTLRFYAKHKNIDIGNFQVKVSGERKKNEQGGEEYNFRTHLYFYDVQDAAMLAKLKEIAEKCPVHKTLKGTITIATNAELLK